MVNIDDYNAENKCFGKENISSFHTQYHCAALDSKDGKICFVESITPEFRKEHKFFCIACGEEMVANLKDDNHRRHFKHKNKTECCCETYLHNLAKKMLAEHFLKSEHFYVSYDIKEHCTKHNQCKYRSEFCMSQKHERKVDIKEFYQHCEIEKSVTGKDGKRYVADICLLSDKTNVPPMIIEIFVSHACTDDKKQSRLWIMEFPVRSEEDISNYCNTESYKEGNGARIKLFGIQKQKPVDFVNEHILRFIHVPQKGSEIRHISCKEANVSLCKESDIELNILRKPHASLGYKEENIIDAIEYDFHIKPNKENSISQCEDCVYYAPFNGPAEADNHNCNVDFFRRRPEGLCGDFDRKRGKISAQLEVLNEIELELIKGSKSKEYHLFVVGPKNFYNLDLIEEFCKDRISELRNQNLVLGVQDKDRTKDRFSKSVFDFAEDNDIHSRMFIVDWEKNGKSAGYKSNMEVMAVVDEFIIFNDPKDRLTQDLISKAKNKNIPVTLFDFEQVTRNNYICPKCGGKLLPRQGRYGRFWQCLNHPDCDYVL